MPRVKKNKIRPIQAKAKRLGFILSMQRENDIITLLLEGKPHNEIIYYISKKYNLKSTSVETYIDYARAIIKDRLKFDLNTLLALHISRYEYLYEELYEMGAYGIAMMALKAKEKLMQFHKEGFHMRVTKGQISQVSVHHVANEFDYMRLEKDKRVRLQELIEKIKKQKQLTE